MRIGVDVGGTNTDAVLMDGLTVIAKIKTPTTADVTGGIATALRGVLTDSGVLSSQIDAVMIGTTHFTNAVIERQRLEPTAAVRMRDEPCPASGARATQNFVEAPKRMNSSSS